MINLQEYQNIFTDFVNVSLSGKLYKMPLITKEEKDSLEKDVAEFWKMAVFALDNKFITMERFDIIREGYKRMCISLENAEIYNGEEE